MKSIRIVLTVLVVVLLATSAFAQVGKGLSGPHYNLNIIGVPHDKTAAMDDSSRHTIFVPLNNVGSVPRQIKIFYVAGDHFEVLDGNATDDGEATIMVPAVDFSDLSYDVYAVGLGKPNGGAIVDVECAYDDPASGGPGDPTFDETCTETLLMGSFDVDRAKGKPQRENISDAFRATGCIDVDNDGVLDAGDYCFSEVWVFNIPALTEYFWDYQNNDLKLMQLRFYETTHGYFTQY